MGKDKLHQIEKLTAHYESVKLQHDNLDAHIQSEYKNYADDEKVRELKARKLQLKDQMSTVLKEINQIKAELNES